MVMQRTGHMVAQAKVSWPACDRERVAAFHAVADLMGRHIGEAVNDGRSYLVQVGSPTLNDLEAEENGFAYVRQDAVVLLADAGQAQAGEYLAVLPDGRVYGRLSRFLRLGYKTLVIEPNALPIEAAQVIVKTPKE